MESTVRTLPNELALVDRAAADAEAFAALYDHYFPSVYNYVRYRVSDPAVADDVTAQIFEHVYHSLHRYRAEKAPFGAWLFGIARNIVKDTLRAQARRRWLTLDAVIHQPSREPQPEEAADHQNMRERLLDALARLQERERDLIALKFASGLNNRQIATITGLSESNVGVILYRAMQQLRGWMKEEN